MIDYTKRYIKTIRLNSFRPLCITDIGMRAVNQYGFPPFIDASCRREPDFENDFPSITSLCRQELFAPNLYPNDIVVYITVKGKWFSDFKHYRLIAILEVIERKENHFQAASWYRLNSKYGIPSNCMVSENPPHSFHETAGNYERTSEIKRFLDYPPDRQKIIGDRKISAWDDEYLEKSKKWGAFIITKPIFRELNTPPILTEDTLRQIFGKIPNTRNPNKLTKEQFKELALFAGINFITS